jgi:Secretion system C-terminal sorting domain
MCSGGIPATPYSQSLTIAPTKASTINFTFQQFNPSLYPPTYNTLSCITLQDTISGVSTTNVTNTADSAIAYKFLLSLNNDVSGPGIDINDQTFNKIYGPDTLRPFGMPNDTITYGPDNIFANSSSSGSTPANSNYVGSGLVGFTYTINGGLITLKGGANYIQQITTVIGGTFNLTYYVCPTIALATSISNFSAYKQNQSVLLQWIAANDQNSYDYEIQYSKNGTDFSGVANMPSATAAAGTVSEYQYQYNLDPSDVGQLYFRIKRTDASGNVSYSIVKVVELDSSGSMGIQTYPNPVVSSVTVLFNEKQTGNFVLELVNISGQVLQQNSIALSNSNTGSFNVNNHPAKGLYFLRATNIANNKQYLTKIIIE